MVVAEEFEIAGAFSVAGVLSNSISFRRLQRNHDHSPILLPLLYIQSRLYLHISSQAAGNSIAYHTPSILSRHSRKHPPCLDDNAEHLVQHGTHWMLLSLSNLSQQQACLGSTRIYLCWQIAFQTAGTFTDHDLHQSLSRCYIEGGIRKGSTKESLG